MLVALALLAALEAAPPAATVVLTRSGSSGAPVHAGPRTLSDVAREMREGRRAVGNFSAVETTVSREPFVLPAFAYEEEEASREPEVVPEPHPPGSAVPYVTGWGGWYGGGVGGTPVRPRPPHVAHHGRGSGRPVSPSAGGASARGGGGPHVPRSSAPFQAAGTWGILPRR